MRCLWRLPWKMQERRFALPTYRKSGFQGCGDYRKRSRECQYGRKSVAQNLLDRCSRCSCLNHFGSGKEESGWWSGSDRNVSVVAHARIFVPLVRSVPFMWRDTRLIEAVVGRPTFQPARRYCGEDEGKRAWKQRCQLGFPLRRHARGCFMRVERYDLHGASERQPSLIHSAETNQ